MIQFDCWTGTQLGLYINLLEVSSFDQSDERKMYFDILNMQIKIPQAYPITAYILYILQTIFKWDVHY